MVCNQHFALGTCTLAGLLCLATGCTALSKPKLGDLFASSSKLKESKYPPPANLVAIWTPATLDTPGKPSIRGFGGRIFFYNDSSQAVPVEGQLVVYAYNDSGKSLPSKTPDKRFAFKPEQLTSHFTPGNLGASYSIWLPWDPVGGPQAEISLVPVFTAVSGQVVMGQSSKNLLAGREPTTQGTLIPLPRQARNEVQQVSYQQTEADSQRFSRTSSGEAEARLQTTSIPLPPSLTQRMAAARPAEAPRLDTNSVPAARQAATGNWEPTASPTLSRTPERLAGTIHAPWSPPDPRSTRFSPSRGSRQVPIGGSPQPVRDPSQWQPDPSGSPLVPLPGLQSAPGFPAPGAWSTGATLPP